MVCTNLTVFASGENLVPKFKDKADRVISLKELALSLFLLFNGFFWLCPILVKSNRNEDCYRDKEGSHAFLDAILLLDPNDQAWCPLSSCSLAWPRTPLCFPGQFPLPFFLAATSCLCLPIPPYRAYPTPAMLLPLLPWPRAKHLLCDTSIRNFIQFPQPSVLLLSEYSFSAYVYLAKFIPIIQFPSIGWLSLKTPSLSPKMGSVALTIISHRSLGSLSVALATCNYVLAGPPWVCNQLTTDIFCVSCT